MGSRDENGKKLTLDGARELLRCQSKIVKDALDRSERAERALSECRTALHWCERQRDEARAMVIAHQHGPDGAASVSAALRGLSAGKVVWVARI
jgi:hypothetical protein